MNLMILGNRQKQPNFTALHTENASEKLAELVKKVAEKPAFKKSLEQLDDLHISVQGDRNNASVHFRREADGSLGVIPHSSEVHMKRVKSSQKAEELLGETVAAGINIYINALKTVGTVVNKFTQQV